LGASGSGPSTYIYGAVEVFDFEVDPARLEGRHRPEGRPGRLQGRPHRLEGRPGRLEARCEVEQGCLHDLHRCEVEPCCLLHGSQLEDRALPISIGVRSSR